MDYTVDAEMGIMKIHIVAMRPAHYAGAIFPSAFSHLFPSFVYFPSLS
jgi:hypothetical protein